MTNLVFNPTFDDVPELETTTVALGGPGAPMNLQAQALGDRDQYLLVQIQNLATVASSGSYNDLTNLPPLGTAAYQNSAAFATAAQGELASGAAQASALKAVAFSGSYLDLINKPSLLPDAPADGNIYGRQSNAWVVVPGGSSSPVSLNNTAQWTKNQSILPVTVTYAATVTVDASQSSNFELEMTGDCVIENPINLVNGMIVNFAISQDATGGHALSFGSLFKWPGATPPVWQTTANSINFFSAYYNGAALLCNGGAGYG